MADRISWEEGWSFIENNCIRKLKNILAGEPAAEYSDVGYCSRMYTMIYNMSTQKDNHSRRLYENYKVVIDDYLESRVLPSLMAKQDDEFMLRELVKTWANHNVMVHWLSRFFRHLDRYFVPRKLVPTVKEVGQTCFKDMVYERFKVKARQAVFALIEGEREGEQIDRDLLKNALDIYVRIRMDNLSCYVKDFEEPFLEESCRYYSAKASNWIMEDSCADYMVKVEKCLRKEKERVSHYLHYSSEHKLLEKVEHVLLLAFNDKYTPDDQ